MGLNHRTEQHTESRALLAMSVIQILLGPRRKTVGHPVVLFCAGEFVFGEDARRAMSSGPGTATALACGSWRITNGTIPPATGDWPATTGPGIKSTEEGQHQGPGAPGDSRRRSHSSSTQEIVM